MDKARALAKANEAKEKAKETKRQLEEKAQKELEDFKKLSTFGKVLKVIQILFSIFPLVSGIALVGAGIYLAGWQTKILGSGPVVACFILAFVMLLLGSLGLHGSRKESRKAMMAYIIVLIISSIIFLAVGISYAVGAEKMIELGFKNMGKQDRFFLESKLNCCGLNDLHDYDVIDAPEPFCGAAGATTTCKAAIKAEVNDNITNLGNFSIVLCVGTLVALILAVLLYRRLPPDGQRRESGLEMHDEEAGKQQI